LIPVDFLEHDFVDGSFDLITVVASVHHMPLSDAHEKMARLLPGGIIGMFGLYRAATVADRAVELAAFSGMSVLAAGGPTAASKTPHSSRSRLASPAGG
jgi:hypothetical protein